jgi:peroxiredoxin
MGYLTSFASLTESIEAAGGVPLIITAEDASHLDAVRDRTGYTREALNDPDHILAKELKSRGLLDAAITERSGYPHGVAQPAVLVMRPDGNVLQQWAIVPSTVSYYPSRIGSASWC